MLQTLAASAQHALLSITKPGLGRVCFSLQLMTQAPQATFKTGVSQTRDNQQAPPRSEAVVPLP
jgi:hypothetical protein